MDRQFHLRVFFWHFLCLFSSFKHNQLKYVEPNSSQKFLGIFGFQKTSKLSFDRAESQNFHLRTFLYILMQNLKCYLSIGTNLQKNCLKVLPQTYDLFVYCFLPTPLIFDTILPIKRIFKTYIQWGQSSPANFGTTSTRRFSYKSNY